MKNLKAQRAAEEKLAAEDAKKAERQRQMEEAAAAWAAKTPEEKRQVYKLAGIAAIVIVLLLAIIGACSGGADNKDSNTATTTTRTTTTTAPPAPVDAPIVISMPLGFAEERNGIRIDAIDIGQHIVDDVNRERAIFDRNNWRVAAQCDQMVGNRLKVGAIKADEAAIISNARQGTSIAENRLQFLLDCP
ncbi:hypothetical protein [Mycolicibacterium thermoresistibile]|uniref:hypothetical protein n=1 Tax=Mycolicibacterium thermoresistibile TaxID=1797 RepID=UPI001038B2B3|nr:hypothetical protein [Mycolicibacterium thermoresistibile]MCV7187066.1 hypothetical protein [Mycolicibacterium thermoresistibile]